MTTLEITHPFELIMRGSRELSQACPPAARRAVTVLTTPRGTDQASEPTSRSAPRFTREIENPFDVPKRACRDAIR